MTSAFRALRASGGSHFRPVSAGFAARLVPERTPPDRERGVSRVAQAGVCRPPAHLVRPAVEWRPRKANLTAPLHL